MESVIVEYNWSLISKSSTNTLGDKEHHVCVSNPASNVEVLDWKLSDYSKSKQDSNLCFSGIVSPVPIRCFSWSGDDFVYFVAWEP